MSSSNSPTDAFSPASTGSSEDIEERRIAKQQRQWQERQRAKGMKRDAPVAPKDTNKESPSKRPRKKKQRKKDLALKDKFFNINQHVQMTVFFYCLQDIITFPEIRHMYDRKSTSAYIICDQVMK